MSAPRWRLVAAWALAAGLHAIPCAAAEDGGTRSVFAQGTGYRALGMGAAFVAVADDATAAMWNPGGLGRASRLEFQAGQTGYFGLEVTEAYAAVVVPDWRWGAASASFRHFGVSGIERRDDRNVLLADNLSDSESEISFGYGRTWREYWSLGGAIKLRRQSLAGLSANGFGLDLGVVAQPAMAFGARAPWAQAVTWGLALTNLVEPGLRLDRETVADPSGVRTGFAYLHPLFGYRSLLASLDFEKSKTSDLKLHAGVEFRLHPLLALRAGLNDGTMTAGTGVRWRDATLDYAYEVNPVDALHRVGISYAFGPTVSQSRELARRAEEEATQARLAEAFQKRQVEQIAGLLARAEEQLDRKQYDEALELLGTIAALEPGNARAEALEAVCLRQKALGLERAGEFSDAAVLFGRVLALAPNDTAAAAGQLRCQAESDSRAARSAEVRRQFAAAIDAFGSDRLLEARDGFRRVLAARPTDEDAAVMLRRTEQAIGRRVQGLMKQSGRAIEGNRLSEATSLLEQAEALDPRAEGLALAQAALAHAKQREAETSRAANESPRVAAPPADVAAALTPQKRREIELLYRRGVDAMKDHRSDDALRYWELVWSADPKFQRVVEYLKREYIMRGMESFAAGKLDEAVGFWERALRVDPNDARAKGYLARAQQQLARTREILGTSR